MFRDLKFREVGFFRRPFPLGAFGTLFHPLGCRFGVPGIELQNRFPDGNLI